MFFKEIKKKKGSLLSCHQETVSPPDIKIFSEVTCGEDMTSHFKEQQNHVCDTIYKLLYLDL